MDKFQQVCVEILEELKKNSIKTQHELTQTKLKILSKYKSKANLKQIPKNADIYLAASDNEREKFKELLSLKPVRTISGVAPIALMSEPYPCPHTMQGIGPCTYCPGGPGSAFGNVPQSYTGKEPSTRRAIRNSYDPYLIVFNRLEHYVAMGRVPDKAEIIIQGGTFTFFPKAYQEYFVKYALKAMNDFSRLFFSKDGNLDILKFKKFFELPRVLSEEDKRIKKTQQKLLYIKNLDLNNLKVKEKAEYLFFGDDVFIGDFFKINNVQNFNALRKIEYNNANEINVSEQNTKLSIIENSIQNPNTTSIKHIQQKLNNEDNKNITLKQMQKENETSFIRCVGLTIETKSDFGKLYHGNLMLELGCTRVEIGVQSIYDDVLEATSRGNTVNDNIESISILKDLGFKINAHYMPGLPLTTKEMDLHGLKQLFENPDYRPDMLKIYPCMVMEGTKLYEDWKAGKFTPLTTKEAAGIIAGAKQHVPKWCRIMRVQRDIPTFVTASGVDRTNLRQYVEKICIEKNIKCKCIRCREAGFFIKSNKKINFNNIQTTVTEYEASQGKEIFIAAEDLANDVLFGFCRLRFPSQFLRDEITKDSALIRELHVFSPSVQIGKKDEASFQHKGIGRSLLIKAEEIARQNGKDKMVILSGIGAREYFRKIGYELEGVYMVKDLQELNATFKNAQTLTIAGWLA
ncbi:tRNA uridine(34) 5-carboxymethylaminomethyl modification radical SAM/GNAT enzyme Elp3 [Candidatus Woesearchaeota archaeon]|nr:tRNA uridine(34) 5-carboxymethylaminomethyl modification radical SAM/GNAT enzyme Elp3 [Candidatus Woesearchaeota archaeon]